MEMLPEILERAVDELLGRASGPLHFRLVFQPIVAIVLATRSGLADARLNRPIFFWTVLTNQAERRLLLQSGWKDIGKVFIVAVVLDCIYQLIELRAIRPLQTLLVAVFLTVIPYVLIRGPIARLMRRLRYKHNPPSLDR